MPLNAKKYTHIIFEILTNPSFKDTYSSIYNQFSQEELNKLWSLSKGIFNGTNSLKALSSSKSDINFYEYLVQTSNSIYPVEHLQYYKDESGRIYLRKLTQMGLEPLSRFGKIIPTHKIHDYTILGVALRVANEFNIEQYR
jgi:hypothetical protein